MPVRRVRASMATDPFGESALRVGFYSSIFTAAITLVTFGFAVTAVPISGPGCVEGCIQYPYLDSVSRYPRDYVWMYLALVMLVSYVIWMVAARNLATRERSIFAQIGLTFAIMAALVLLVTYFTQASVVPVSLIHGETEGIPLLTQYNVHGLFIALEEIGYLLMSLSFLFVAQALPGTSRTLVAARWIFMIASGLAFAALCVIGILYGLNREYRFEVIVISINWLVLIANGILLGVAFREMPAQ